MPCQVLVSNKSGIAKTEIVSLASGDNKWSAIESMQQFLMNGGLFDDWSRLFSIVKITDKNLNDIQFLNEANDDVVRKWVFIEPPRETQEWKDLYLNGEVSRTYAEISQYLVER